MDRIRILLVDDKPEFAIDSHRRREGRADFMPLPRKWRDTFELYWIQDPIEARWLLDAFHTMSYCRPELVYGSGLPPEMLFFDYAMTQSVAIDRTDVEPTNVMARVRQVLTANRLRVPGFGGIVPPAGAMLGGDRIGCYIGGTLARAFAAHPCGAVPTTVHDRKPDTDATFCDAAFYEWFNASYFLNLFDGKTRNDPSWDLLIPVGARALRERIRELAGAGLLGVSAEGLQTLSADPSQMFDRSLEIKSRYGLRDLPVKGLFADFIDDQDGFTEQARSWAMDTLQGFYRGQGETKIRDAADLAERFFNVRRSEVWEDRQELSALSIRTKTDEDDEATWRALEDRRRELAERYEVVGSIDGYEQSQSAKVTRFSLGSLPSEAGRGTNGDECARWAALMLAVRAEMQWSAEFSAVRELSKVLTTDELERGQVDRNSLSRRVGAAALADLVSEGYLRRSDSSNWMLDVASLTAGPVEEVMETLIWMCEPAPKRLLTWQHAGADGVSESALVTQPLKRLGGCASKSSWGRLTLNLRDVLEDKPFDCPACLDALASGKPPPKEARHKNSKGQDYSHGLRPGELAVLQEYARSIGFDEAVWPAWLRRRLDA